MSVLGVSSYFLWTQKGQTVMPLVRGSGFVMAFQQLNAFYSYHVVSAAHVTCPVKHRKLYGDTVGLKAIGERHISTRLLVPDSATHKVATSYDLELRQQYMPNTDVASLRLSKETEFKAATQAARNGAVHDGGRTAASSASAATSPSSHSPVPVEAIEPDLDPIEEGTELVLCGVRTTEERANPNDDGLTLQPLRLAATCKAALVSLGYGTVLLASVDGPVGADDAAAYKTDTVSPLPLSMCGGPVLRRATGKCVGVIAARVMMNAPPRDPHSAALYQDPYLDISEHVSLHPLWPLDVAFVPIGEFYDSLRRCEM